jgi:hypothetical protein
MMDAGKEPMGQAGRTGGGYGAHTSFIQIDSTVGPWEVVSDTADHGYDRFRQHLWGNWKFSVILSR